MSSMPTNYGDSSDFDVNSSDGTAHGDSQPVTPAPDPTPPPEPTIAPQPEPTPAQYIHEIPTFPIPTYVVNSDPSDDPPHDDIPEDDGDGE
jgi:hypothetical protein